MWRSCVLTVYLKFYFSSLLDDGGGRLSPADSSPFFPFPLSVKKSNCLLSIEDKFVYAETGISRDEIDASKHMAMHVKSYLSVLSF
jgi:hypothetical protein